MSAAVVADTPTVLAAIALRDRGWRPFPLDHPSLPECAGSHKTRPCDGKRGKHPVGGWGTQTASPPTDQMLRLWFDGPARNIGIAAGPSGLLVLDEDETDALTLLADQLGEKAPDTYRVLTSRGWHYYLADPGREFGNGAGALADHGIDVRGGQGAGGYVVAAGSRHAAGTAYVAEDDHAEPAPIPEWIKAQLRAGRTKSPGSTTGSAPANGWTSSPRPGYRGELVGQYRRHLDGVRTRGGEFRHELFLAALDGWRLVNVGVLPEFTMLMEIKAAITRVWGAEPDDRDRAIVYDEAPAKAQVSPWVLLDPPGGSAVEAPGADPHSEDGPGAELISSWLPVDLDALWDGSAEPRTPDLLCRTDGVAMFYAGETHSVHGESESGKSWVAQTAVVECLAAGERVLYVDFESDGPSILARLRALGLTRDQLAGLAYVCPDGPRDAGFALLLDQQFAYCVIDGVTAAMAADAIKSNDQDAVTVWNDALPKRIARRTGAAVVLVDHVSKARDERGRFAIGSQAKMSNVSGSAFYVDVEHGLGQGLVGQLRLYVGKDRPGGVRKHAGKMRKDRLQPFARYQHDATNPMRILVTITPWLDEEDEQGPGVMLSRETPWNDAEQAPLPDDVCAYGGAGKSATLALARFMRARAVGGIGMNLTDARSALAALKGPDGKSVHERTTVGRAWGALRDMGRIGPAESNMSGNPTGLHWWIKRSGDPS